MHLFRFQRSRGGHLLPHGSHCPREAEPQGPGLLHGRHARLQRGEEDRRNPDSVSAIRFL